MLTEETTLSVSIQNDHLDSRWQRRNESKEARRAYGGKVGGERENRRGVGVSLINYHGLLLFMVVVMNLKPPFDKLFIFLPSNNI